ncbi:MAG TPA: M20/M25/M40 family metallo-hydrolase, partial [Pyrinomonadaceae bacterium]|nr:M20/M25/M40 family metallo-hydrolase [Pyrinomonadaceae bacterium]
MNVELTRQILNVLQARQPEIERFIQALVEVESPSGDEGGSRAVVDLLAQAADQLDCVSEVERASVPGFGQHLVIRAFQTQSEAGQILLVGHTDTVHARGSLSERPWRREAGKIYGPGIFDMKANCALAIEVLRVLTELQATPKHAVTLVLTCDEEVGSLSGWPLIEQVANSHQHTRCAFV